jgi:hypothetical protein
LSSLPKGIAPPGNEMPLLPSILDFMAPFHSFVRNRNGRRPISVQDALASALQEKDLLRSLHSIVIRARCIVQA